MDTPWHYLQPTQEVAFHSIATEMLYGGAAGGGKSHLMRVAAIAWALSIPGIQIYLFRRNLTDLVKNHMEGPTSFPVMLAEFVDSGRCTIVDASKSATISFGNGSKIFCCHCQHEKDMYKYQGPEIHLLLMDELTHFTEKIYRFLRGRVRLGGLKVPTEYKHLFPQIICGSNPGGIGHNWVKQTFVTNAPEYHIKRMGRAEGGMLRQYIPAKLADNPKLLENDPEYEARLDGLGDPALVKAMKEGDWDIVAGGAIDDVWKKAIHMIKPFTIPANWRVDRSFDWGSSAPFSVGWWAESNGEDVLLPDGKSLFFQKGSLIRIDEWYGWNGQANQGNKMLAKDIAKGILEREKTIIAKHDFYKIVPGPADSSIYDTENGVCIAKDMKKIGVKWVKANKSKGSRINGLELIRSMLKAATERPMEHAGLFAFNHCTHFSRTMPVLPRDDRNRDDVDSNSEDHLYDDVRYRVLETKRKTIVTEV